MTDSSEKKYSVESVAGYIEIVREILDADKNNRKPVFRGHRDKEWELESSGDRKNLNARDYHDIWLECYKHNYKTIKTKDFLDTVVNMQHYMLPTKLLDWTYNPLIALYFAVEQNFDKDREVKDGEVIVAHPHRIYEPDLKETKILSRYLKKIYHAKDTVDEELSLFKLLHFNKVMFFCVAQSNERIRAQAGLFSILVDISKRTIADATDKEIIRIIGNERDTDKSREKLEEIRNEYEEMKKEYKKRLRGEEMNTNFFFDMEKHKEEIREKHPLLFNVLFNVLNERKSWIWDYYKSTHTDENRDYESIIIPAEKKSEIAKELEQICNIHARTIYPDFFGYTEYIRNKVSAKSPGV